MWTIDAIKEANHMAGQFWFSPDTLRFFRSRIGSTVYEGPGGVYFVSSEQFGFNGTQPRRYTVRQFFPADARIGTVGPFNELSRAVANTRAAKLARGSLDANHQL